MAKAQTSAAGRAQPEAPAGGSPQPGPARRPWMLAAGLVLLALAGGFAAVIAANPDHPPVAGLDRWWLSVVRTWQATPLTEAGKALSYVFGPWGGTVIVAVAVVVLLVRRRIWTAVFLALAEACGSGTSQLIKHLVVRPRPPHPLVTADFGSFPSGHVITAVGVGLALTMALVRPGRRALALAGVAAVAVMMIVCRTYLQAHWLTDTLEGAAVGIGLVLVLGWIFAPMMTRERDGAGAADLEHRAPSA